MSAQCKNCGWRSETGVVHDLEKCRDDVWKIDDEKITENRAWTKDGLLKHLRDENNSLRKENESLKAKLEYSGELLEKLITKIK